MRSFEQQQKSNNASSLTIHPQLEVGGKDDPQEKEANAMADKVMRMSDGDTVRPKMGDEEEGKVRKMGDEEDGKVMKMGDDEEKKVMKMGDEEDGKVMKMDAGGGGGMAAPANVASGIQNTKGGGQNLPQNVQQDLGGKMGADFSDVKVHTDDHANEMSESISAKAFTHGKDIYFRQGNYSPESGDGKKLLAHELTHTMQSGGAVRRQTNNPSTYKVKTKDTLYSIAKRFGTTVEALQSLNGLHSVDIEIGQVLKIPQTQSPQKSNTPPVDDKNELKMYVTDKIASVKVYDDNRLVMQPRLAGNDQNEYVVFTYPGPRATFRRIEVTTITGEKQSRVFAPGLMLDESFDRLNQFYKLRIIAKPTIDNVLKRKSPYPKGDYSVQKQLAINTIQDAINFNTSMNLSFTQVIENIETEMGFDSTDLGKSIFEGILNVSLAAISAAFPVAGVIGTVFMSAYQAYDKYSSAADANAQLYAFSNLKSELHKQFIASDSKLTTIKQAIDSNFELMQMLSTAPKFPDPKLLEKVSREYEIRVWKEVLGKKMRVKYLSNRYFYNSKSRLEKQNNDSSIYYNVFTAGHDSTQFLFWEWSRVEGYWNNQYWLESDAEESTKRIALRLFGDLKIPKKDVFFNWGLPYSTMVVPSGYWHG